MPSFRAPRELGWATNACDVRACSSAAASTRRKPRTRGELFFVEFLKFKKRVRPALGDAGRARTRSGDGEGWSITNHLRASATIGKDTKNFEVLWTAPLPIGGHRRESTT